MSKPPPKPPRIRNAGARGGRPPKPVQLHKIEGTYQPSRHAGRADPLAAPGDRKGKRPPSRMDEAQRKLWHEVLADAPPGVLRRIDAVLFANYVELLDRYRRLLAAQRQLDRAQPMPFLVKAKDGVVVSPYLRPLNHCIFLLTRLAGEMGFTPVSRVRLPAGIPAAEEVDDGWASFGRLRLIDGGKTGES
jgi:phage terminase small subunit